MMFQVNSKPTPLTVFNLQELDWIHCEEETGAYYQLSRFIYKLVIVFQKKKFKWLILRKKYLLLKKNHTIYYSFFFQRDFWAYILNAMITSNLLYL